MKSNLCKKLDEILSREEQTHKEPCGLIVKLYPMRETCQKAGHCLALTRESDCNLYPVRLGWCRGRVSMKGGVNNAGTTGTV